MTSKLVIKFSNNSSGILYTDYKTTYIAKYTPNFGGDDDFLLVLERTITSWYNIKLNSLYSTANITGVSSFNGLTIEALFDNLTSLDDIEAVLEELKMIVSTLSRNSSTTKTNISPKTLVKLENEDGLESNPLNISFVLSGEAIPLEDITNNQDSLETTSDLTQDEEFQQSLEQEQNTNQELGREERTSENINQNSNNNPNGEQITPGVRSVFRNEIKARKIVFDTPANDEERAEIAESLGVLPFLWYNSYQIDYVDIEFLELSIVGGLPTLKATFLDTFNKMKDEGFPLDDTKISLFLNPRTQMLKPIHLDFKIVNFSVSGNSYTVTGLVDIPKLYIKNYKSLRQKTSYQALQDIARECGMGFNSNVDNTNDEMTWVNTGDRNLDFIENITEVSYISDETFLISYIDFYYNLNYVDLEKELNRDIKQELGIGNIGLEEILKLDTKEKIRELILTNDEAQSQGNGYFSSYRIINNSTMVSIKEGYLTRVKYYDQVSKDFLIFDVDSITTKGNEKIILKGAPQDEEFFKSNTNLIYTGKMDVDNTHKNYNYSYIQNVRNIVDLEKIALEINMGTPNFNLYRFQKVLLAIVNNAPTPTSSMINGRLSGEWMIIDISFKYNGKLTQVVKLVKRELELSAQEYNNESQSGARKEEGEDTSNDNDVVNNSGNPVDTTNTDVSQQSNQTDDDDFPLTLQMWETIYRGRINPKVIRLYYQPLKEALTQYNINTKERIAAFLSQVNAETGFLKFVSELGSGEKYEGRDDLGNTQQGDGTKFKGRGLIQITGRSNYKAAGKFLNKDFISNPTSVSADNRTHIKGAANQEQIKNSILTAVRFWLNSPRGNLNKFADKMRIKEQMGLGSASITDLPKTNAEGKKFGSREGKNFATKSGGNVNFINLTIISLGINGGYNGYDERIKNWIRIREVIK